jgi:hypothetical protein
VEQTMLRVHHVLRREGKIPKLTIDGKEIKLKHSSPITLIGNREDVQVVERAMQSMLMFGEQAAIDTFKPEEVSPYITNKLGVPSSLTNTKDEILELQKQRAEQQQAMMAMQAEQEAAKGQK